MLGYVTYNPSQNACHSAPNAWDVIAGIQNRLTSHYWTNAEFSMCVSNQLPSPGFLHDPKTTEGGKFLSETNLSCSKLAWCNGKSPFLIGDTSWNGCFSIVMLVYNSFRGCTPSKNSVRSFFPFGTPNKKMEFDFLQIFVYSQPTSHWHPRLKGLNLNGWWWG